MISKGNANKKQNKATSYKYQINFQNDKWLLLL